MGADGTRLVDSVLSRQPYHFPKILPPAQMPCGVSVCGASRDLTRPPSARGPDSLPWVCPVLGPEIRDPLASGKPQILSISL